MSTDIGDIRRAISVAKEAGVNVTLTATEVSLILDQRRDLAIHLVTVMVVASDNLSYAPSKDEAENDYTKLAKAKNYLIAQGFVTQETLERIRS